MAIYMPEHIRQNRNETLEGGLDRITVFRNQVVIGLR